MKLPKYLTLIEYDGIVAWVKHTQPCNYKQYLIAMCLAFKAGMRISEIVGYQNRVPKLMPDAVNIVQHSILVKSGKGNKDRVVPLPQEIDLRAVKLLPLTLSRRSLQSFFSRCAREVLNKELTFHSLRHGFGSHLASNGRPLHEIQMLMGHSRLDTTGIYLHANPKDAIEKARSLF